MPQNDASSINPRLIEVSCSEFLRKLPLLDFTANRFTDSDLSHTYFICAQHLVSTTYSLFHSLLQLGLQAGNLSAIGKCYSTDPSAFQEMKRMGIDVCPSSLAFDSHQSFDDQYRKNIQDFVLKRKEKITNSDFNKIIVLDDGAELISAIAPLVKNNDSIVGIEQTSSGFHKLNEKEINFPIINVARSNAKLTYESPIIAKLVCNTLIYNINNFSIQSKKILIIGNGFIGARIKEVLQTMHEVHTFDKIPSRSSIKLNEFERSLKNFDLIIGCTGKSILMPEHYKMFKEPVILVSASSSDREFNAVYLRKRVAPVTDCHANLTTDGICLINCGFPINFSSEYRAIDIDDLQLTRSLLLAAILQANSHSNFSKRGFIPLDYQHENEIIQKYLTIFPNGATKNNIAGK